MVARRITMARFEELVAAALDDLPPEWAVYLDEIIVQVEDEPDAEDLMAMGLDPSDAEESELFGLYQGVPRTARGGELYGLPDRIVIYRGPTLRAAVNRHEVLQIVRETVLHELGHHFGLEEDELPF